MYICIGTLYRNMNTFELFPLLYVACVLKEYGYFCYYGQFIYIRLQLSIHT